MQRPVARKRDNGADIEHRASYSVYRHASIVGKSLAEREGAPLMNFST